MPEKDGHEWQQPCIEAEYFIDKLLPSDPQAIVCDPCVGSGTVPIAAKRLGRRWIGFEIDRGSANQAATKINAAHRCKLYKPGLACRKDCPLLPKPEAKKSNRTNRKGVRTSKKRDVLPVLRREV